MMLCGFQTVLKFLLGRMLGVMRGQRGSEYWQLLVRLETSEALGRLQHAGAVQRSAMAAFRHRFTLR